MADKFKEIVTEYQNKAPLYEQFAVQLEAILHGVLKEKNISVHSISKRVKSRESLENKLRKPDANYQNISEVTDIVGLRITTFFADDVDQVAAVITQEFTIDNANSIDKRTLYEPDRFGYLSLHHIVSMPQARTCLTENQRFINLKAEIQTRSILQHTWAEIEHDLGYKATDVPKAIKRRFYRLASLLELADEEFCLIRKELVTYKTSLPTQLRDHADEVGIDKASLSALYDTEEFVVKLDEEVAKAIGSKLEPFWLENDGQTVKYLGECGIKSIAQLKEVLHKQHREIVAFAEEWTKGPGSVRSEGDETVHRGIALFYLIYVLFAKTGDRSRIQKYCADRRFGPDSPPKLAQLILDTYLAITPKNQK